MTLDNINNRIAELGKLSETDAINTRGELLTLLMQRDEFYCVMTVNGKFLSVPAPSIVNDIRAVFLRVFTHEEAAGKFGQPAKLDTLELAKQAKKSLLAGDSGILLNDGENWLGIDIPSFLSLFYTLAGLRQPDPAYLAALDLVTHIRSFAEPALFFTKDKAALTVTDDPNGAKQLDMDVLEQAASSGLAIVLQNGMTVPGKQFAVLLGPQNERDIELCFPGETEETKRSAKPLKAVKLKKPEIKLPKFEKPDMNGILEKVKQKKVWIPAVSILAAVILCVGIGKVISGTGLTKFQDALDDRDYGAAAEMYHEYSDKKRYEADAMLETAPQALVEKYGSGEISAGEVSAGLTALTVFPRMDEPVLAAAAAADMITDSKTAYTKGLESSIVSNRLTEWKNVIDADTEHMERVKSAVKDGKQDNIDAVMAEIKENTESGLYKRAYNLSLLLQYWYPGDAAVEKKVKSLEVFSTANDSALSRYPISVDQVSVRSGGMENNGIDLFIKWRNVSAKPIKEIAFYVTPVNELGKPVQSTGDKYVMYRAVDKNEYGPGDGVEDDAWGWKSVWHNSVINSATVVKVDVTFKDGVSKTYVFQDA